MADCFGTETWSLVLPEGWQAQHDSECATLMSAGEIGIMQIATAFKDGDVEDADLQGFVAERVEAGDVPKTVEAGDFVGLEVAHDDDEHRWRTWYLRNAEQLLLVNYYCPLAARGTDDKLIDEVLASLTVVPE